MLALPKHRTEEAIALLTKHGEATDLNARIRKYANDPFYAPFCIVKPD